DIDKAAVRRVGSDVSLITWGGNLPKAMEAARQLDAAGIGAEVLDLRTLRPLDDAAIVATVSKTHRAVVIDEMWKTGSFAAEVCTRIVEQAFFELDAPLRRVCSAEVPIAYARHMELAALPSVEQIVQAATEIAHHE